MTPPPGPLPVRSNGPATAALVCALLGYVTCGLLSIAAVVLGMMGLGQARTGHTSGRGLAVAGLVLGAPPLLAWIALIAYVLFFPAAAADFVNGLGTFLGALGA